MIQTCEAITEIPVAQVQIVEKQIPKVMTEVIEKIQEVPQVLIEEQLVEVTQVQTCEVIRQVQKPMVQQVQISIPRITTQVVEKVQAVPATLINEVAVDLPQVQTIEVLKQTANCTSQRIVQNSTQFERAVPREQVVERIDAATIGGVYAAGVIGVRENVLVQPTAVERVSPIMTQSMVGERGMGMERMIVAPTYADVFASPNVMGGQVMETFASPTYENYETVAAPTYTEIMAAPTYLEAMVAPTTYVQ